MAKKKKEVKKSDYRKVTLTMPIDMIEYLESIGITSMYNKGRKFAKTEVVRAYITLLEKLKIDFTGLADKDDLVKRITQGMKDYRG